MLLLYRALAIVIAEDDVLVELVILVAITDELGNESLEHFDVVFITINLDGSTPGSKAQLRVESLEQQDITVVRAVENDRICLFEDDYFFDHYNLK